MLEALVDRRRELHSPRHMLPPVARWAQPPGSYKLVALWVHHSHTSELPLPRNATIGLWCQPEHEVPPLAVAGYGRLHGYLAT
jgi:hypothetical protein